jgi:aspartate ammonia-lyase
MGLDQVITISAQSGQLELNAFLPVISQSLFEMLDLLKNGISIFIDKCIKGITANREECNKMVNESLVLVTALVAHIGYDKASYVARKCLETGKTVNEVLILEKIMNREDIEKVLNPFSMTRPGVPGQI